MNKSISLFVCVALAVLATCNSSVEARPKRSIYYAAAPVVASVPVAVQTSHVVHANPTSVVKTEHVRSGDHASYSYTSEVKTQPIVHTQTHAAAAPVVAAAPVATAAVAAVPTHAYYPSYASHAYYPSYYPSYSYGYSPYSYVIGK